MSFRSASVLLVSLLAVSTALAQEESTSGRGTVSMGYTVVDQTGNRSVSPETFDVYEDGTFALRGFELLFPHSYSLRADLENLNLDSRSVRGRFYRPGRVTISGDHRKSRRIYDTAGDTRAYRERSHLNAVIMLHPALRLSGGYAHTGRDGEFLLFGGTPFSDAGIGPGNAEPVPQLTDYDMKSYSAGVQIRHRSSMIDAKFESNQYSDNLFEELDRRSQFLRLTAFTPVPSVERLTLTGGLTTGWVEIEARDEKRKENSAWGAGNWTFAPKWTGSYKLLFSRIDNEADGLETDNAISTALLTRRFPGVAEVTAGYEFRSQDDLTARSETHALLLKGSVRPVERVRIRGQVAFASEQDDDRVTLVGDEERLRQRWEIRYSHSKDVKLTVQYRDTHREFDEIGTSADYYAVSNTLSFACPHWGRGSGSYSYSKGQYDNVSSDYAFEQHLVSARASTLRYRRVMLTGGLTYLRTRLDTDIEKILTTIGANIELSRGYEFDVEYNGHIYDDFVITDRYYTANIVKFEIRKRFSF